MKASEWMKHFYSLQWIEQILSASDLLQYILNKRTTEFLIFYFYSDQVVVSIKWLVSAYHKSFLYKIFDI